MVPSTVAASRPRAAVSRPSRPRSGHLGPREAGLRCGRDPTSSGRGPLAHAPVVEAEKRSSGLPLGVVGPLGHGTEPADTFIVAAVPCATWHERHMGSCENPDEPTPSGSDARPVPPGPLWQTVQLIQFSNRVVWRKENSGSPEWCCRDRPDRSRSCSPRHSAYGAARTAGSSNTSTASRCTHRRSSGCSFAAPWRRGSSRRSR